MRKLFYVWSEWRKLYGLISFLLFSFCQFPYLLFFSKSEHQGYHGISEKHLNDLLGKTGIASSKCAPVFKLLSGFVRPCIVIAWWFDEHKVWNFEDKMHLLMFEGDVFMYSGWEPRTQTSCSHMFEELHQAIYGGKAIIFWTPSWVSESACSDSSSSRASNSESSSWSSMTTLLICFSPIAPKTFIFNKLPFCSFAWSSLLTLWRRISGQN